MNKVSSTSHRYTSLHESWTPHFSIFHVEVLPETVVMQMVATDTNKKKRTRGRVLTVGRVVKEVEDVEEMLREASDTHKLKGDAHRTSLAGSKAYCFAKIRETTPAI